MADARPKPRLRTAACPRQPPELPAAANRFEGLPGGDLVSAGLADLQARRYSEEALLVLVAGPRLRALGIDVPDPEEVPRPRAHRLYSAIEARLPRGAHSYYNSLIRRIVSFARAYTAASHGRPSQE